MGHPVAQIQHISAPLRCYARRSGRFPDRWMAHCVDLDIVVVSASYEDAKAKLESALLGYVRAAFQSEDDSLALGLLHRPAPLRFRALWYLLRAMDKLRSSRDRPFGIQRFVEYLPLRPAFV